MRFVVGLYRNQVRGGRVDGGCACAAPKETRTNFCGYCESTMDCVYGSGENECGSLGMALNGREGDVPGAFVRCDSNRCVKGEIDADGDQIAYEHCPCASYHSRCEADSGCFLQTNQQ